MTKGKNCDFSFHIRLWSPRCSVDPLMEKAPNPLLFLYSPPSGPVLCFLSMLSGVNILHQALTIMTFIFALSFTGVACVIYT